MKAVREQGVPVPKMLGLCEEERWVKPYLIFCLIYMYHSPILVPSSLLGTPFYVMEHVEGRIFKDISLPGMTPSQRRDIYLAMCGALAKIHQVDLKKAGLEDYSKPGRSILIHSVS